MDYNKMRVEYGKLGLLELLDYLRRHEQWWVVYDEYKWRTKCCRPNPFKERM